MKVLEMELSTDFTCHPDLREEAGIPDMLQEKLLPVASFLVANMTTQSIGRCAFPISNDKGV